MCNITSDHCGWQKKIKKGGWRISHEVNRSGWLRKRKGGEGLLRRWHWEEIREKWGIGFLSEGETKAHVLQMILTYSGIVRSPSLVYPTKWGVIGKWPREVVWQISKGLAHSTEDIWFVLIIIGSHFEKLILSGCAEYDVEKEQRQGNKDTVARL